MQVANARPELSMLCWRTQRLRSSVLLTLERIPSAIDEVRLSYEILISLLTDLSTGISSFTFFLYVLPFSKGVLLVKGFYSVLHFFGAVSCHHDVVHVQNNHRTDTSIIVITYHEGDIHSSVLESDRFQEACYFFPPCTRCIRQAVNAFQHFKYVTPTKSLEGSVSWWSQIELSFCRISLSSLKECTADVSFRTS